MKAAFGLKIGALSDVIETDYGIHILTVTERKAGTPSVLEKCIVEVLEAYTEDARAATRRETSQGSAGEHHASLNRG